MDFRRHIPRRLWRSNSNQSLNPNQYKIQAGPPAKRSQASLRRTPLRRDDSRRLRQRITKQSNEQYTNKNYGEALQKSLLFYEANRSGDLDENRNHFTWRSDSGLSDGHDGVYFGDYDPSNLQSNLDLDLTGGYYDAGDSIKFGLPLAFTLTTLSWGGQLFQDGYKSIGQFDNLIETIRWGTDYLLKAHVVNPDGSTRFFIAQVGDPITDHNQWLPPERQATPRPALAVTPEKPGSDVAAQSAAALASASILFRLNNETTYADLLLNNAKSLFAFADGFRGRYTDSIPSTKSSYNSWNGYYDDLCFGAAWLARASAAAGQDSAIYRQKSIDIYTNNIGRLANDGAYSWDNCSYGTAILLAKDCNLDAYQSDIEHWLDSWINGTNGVQKTRAGLRYIKPWGSLRYAANTAFMAAVYADETGDPTGIYQSLVQETIDYITGENPLHRSYIVGYGANYPERPHHRGASGLAPTEYASKAPNKHVIYGALVGGPTSPNDFDYRDTRTDYIGNEVALDYNSGLSGALAYIVQKLGGQALGEQQLAKLPGI